MPSDCAVEVILKKLRFYARFIAVALLLARVNLVKNYLFPELEVYLQSRGSVMSDDMRFHECIVSAVISHTFVFRPFGISTTLKQLLVSWVQTLPKLDQHEWSLIVTELRQFLDAVRCVVVHDDTPAGATSAPSTAAHSKAHEEARAIVASQHGTTTASQLKFPHVPIDRSLRVTVPSEEVSS